MAVDGDAGANVRRMWALPPFFTLQPVLATRQKQLAMWVDLVVDHVRAHKQNVLYVHEPQGSTTANVFHNRAINRKLSPEAVRAVLDEVVSRGYGIWRDASQTAIVMSDRTVQELSQLIYQWAKDTQHMNEICTIFELHSGDSTMGQPFHGANDQVLVAAVRLLADKGQASIIPAETSDETGVKFLDQ
ncbi:ESCRT-II complex subunit VPS25 [Plasmodiophora brassicae]